MAARLALNRAVLETEGGHVASGRCDPSGHVHCRGCAVLLPVEMASTFTTNFALFSCPGAAVLSDPTYFNSSMLSVLCITLLVPTELFAVIGLLFDFDTGYYVALPGLHL